MSENLNATCAICGEKYHVCRPCRETKVFKPWRTITDSINCYKIYIIIHDYTNKKITKEKAKEQLSECTMPKTLQPHIADVIADIMSVQSNTKKKSATSSEKANIK